MATQIRAKIDDGIHTPLYSDSVTCTTEETKEVNIPDLSAISTGRIEVCLQYTGDAGQIGERIFLFYSANDHLGPEERKNAFLEFEASEETWVDLDPIVVYKYTDATNLKASFRFKP